VPGRRARTDAHGSGPAGSDRRAWCQAGGRGLTRAVPGRWAWTDAHGAGPAGSTVTVPGRRARIDARGGLGLTRAVPVGCLGGRLERDWLLPVHNMLSSRGTAYATMTPPCSASSHLHLSQFARGHLFRILYINCNHKHPALRKLQAEFLLPQPF